jgi:hypothetical protein
MAISPARRNSMSHLAQIHPDRIVGAVHRLGGALDHGGFWWPGFFGRLLGGLLVLHDVDAHLGEHRHRASICSEETPLGGRTPFSSS